MLQLAGQAGESKRQASTIIDEVHVAVSRWPDHAARAGVTGADTRRIADALAKLR